ncbi:hypothetical protein HN51_028836 [Arachis hypogaea]
MANQIQQSSADQRKNVQLIADAVVGVNERWKVGEKLTQLGFGDDEVVRVILKFAESPNVETVDTRCTAPTRWRRTYTDVDTATASQTEGDKWGHEDEPRTREAPSWFRPFDVLPAVGQAPGVVG